jgi:hypothetical protein
MPFAMRCYVIAVISAAAVLVATVPWSRTSLLNLGVLSVLAAVAERVSRVQIGARGATVSVSLVVTLAAVSILPPAAAAVVGVASMLLLLRRQREIMSAFTIAICALIPAAGSSVCYLLRGHDHGVYLNFPAFLLPFFAAVTTALLLNGLLVAGAMSLAGRAPFLGVWRSDLLRGILPYYSSSVLALIIIVLWQDIGAFTILLVVVPMYVTHWVLSQYSNEQRAYEATISALVQAVEIKDHYTRGHSERVAKGSELIARRMAMAEDRIAKLRYAGLLHDIGKLGVPTRLLAKPGKLTDEEYAQLCLHPNQGVAVIRDIRFLTDVYDGILYHHERLDGRGYPSGKSGDEIPEFARILGVADAFDAMTSTRSYRAARPVTEALAELWRGAGTQFDPALVRAFEEALALQAAAGDAWQVTDEPVSTLDTVPAGGVVEAPAFAFEDHDDPTVGADWYPNRIGAGEYLLREGVRGLDPSDPGPRPDPAPDSGSPMGSAGRAGGAWFRPAGRGWTAGGPAEAVAGPEAMRPAEAWPAEGRSGEGRSGETASWDGPARPWEPTVPLSGRPEPAKPFAEAEPAARSTMARRPATRPWDLAESLPLPQPAPPAGSPELPQPQESHEQPRALAWRERLHPAEGYDNVFPIRPESADDPAASVPAETSAALAAGHGTGVFAGPAEPAAPSVQATTDSATGSARRVEGPGA